MIIKVKELKTCLCCENEDLKLILDLFDQPLANSYIGSNCQEEEYFPLKLNFCPKCTHLQLSHAVHPDYLFKHYIYVSGTSNTLLEYFKWFVDFTKTYNKKAKSVLDIACNDGSQLNFFRDAGFETYGIDPAENLYELSSRNHTIICDYFTQQTSKQFNKKFDVIVAQNVFAHNDYPDNFLEYCKPLLSKDGLIFIQTSQANMIANNEFDTIYHEHLSFFSVKSFCTLAKRCGYNIIDVLRTPVHGTSFVFVLSLNREDRSSEFISKEITLDEEILNRYISKISAVMHHLVKELEKYKNNGYTLVGYGAAAKGNTLLNYGKIKLDYIVDDNSLKHNLYTPGMNILIKHPDSIIKEEKVVVIPLAWNFYEEIKKKVLERKKDVTFIRYFPNLMVEKYD